MNTKFLIHKESGTVIHADDRRTLRYGYDDFLNRVVKGDDCFICGCGSGSKSFNNEHVIPKWILKAYAKPKAFMILPNGTNIKNYAYTVPCCKDCNAELSRQLEIPISYLLKRDYDFVSDALQRDESLYLKLFHWVCLLFFKTHLKDTYLDADRDRRKFSGSIGDTYCWHPLYHVHGIIRQHHTGVKLTKHVQGTILVFEALVETPEEEFDYLDNLNSQVVMVKVGKIIILAVLNDCRFCLAAYKTMLSKINGPLNSVQILELFARLRYLNENIKKRPRFHSLFDNDEFIIGAKMPKKMEVLPEANERVSLFKLMRFYIEDLMPQDLPGRDQLLLDLEEGRAQYIFDENMNFCRHESHAERRSKLPASND